MSRAGRASRAYHKGRAAENFAARHYEARGGQVLARRFKTREGELDLVIGLDGVIVFVEVKARKTLPDALTALPPAQQARLQACASQYLARHADLDTPCRFDLFALGSNGEFDVIENLLG